MEEVRTTRPFDAFKSSLILYHLPNDFRLDSTPEFQFQVWVYLPNLPLPLWNPNAIGKIASAVGEPIEVDYKTISNLSVAGPKCLVLVNALKLPIHYVDIKMHNGNTFSHKIVYEYFPMLCSVCKRVRHTAYRCRANVTNP